jgi:hypothetical protein
MPRSLPQHVLNAGKAGFSESALEDGPPLAAFQNSDKTKFDARRASDGTHLSKKEKASAGDLKCEHCGKTYKHGSCLHKHRWVGIGIASQRLRRNRTDVSSRTDGNTLHNGRSHRNCSFPSTNKCSFLKRLQHS